MTHTLIIRHIPSDNSCGQFRVESAATGKATNAVEVAPPDEITVEGRPKSNLLQDLTWYLEKFLDYPFSPNTEIAKRVTKALEKWGEETFDQLFTGKGRDWFTKAYDAGLKNLTIKIASDDPRILAWPWEALKDPDGITLAHNCNIERQLNELHDPAPLPQNLPTNCLNILLVIARPKEQDVGYHAISRPLVELAAKHDSPINVDVLRPPTFKQLRKMLTDKTGHYHIVHFDGHGGYGNFNHDGGIHTLQSASGKLLFENENGDEDLISAEVLTTLLSEFNIPIMVLNACQSARIDEQAENPFASVAAALIKAGIRSVVAMGYSLFVSGAKQFVPAFYERLFASGEVAEAVRAGRGEMLLKPLRQCLVGEAPLADWMVPVLYQQDPVKLAFVQQPNPTKTEGIALPEEAALGDYGFIGRDSAILQLERRSRLQPQAAILIHGMAGIGKTTLVKGYLQWLQQTNGL
ncbi:MAG: CHAT domain-containing protein, partial [Psychrosphaera sp.]|nr:CHAT domain-containing protein [Psychrosphaera sp.]